MKKRIRLALAAALALVMTAGCAGSADRETEMGREAGLEPAALELWCIGEEYPAQKRVMETFCETYREELNLEKIEFNYVSSVDYEDKMISLVAAGDDFDAMFVADWLLYDDMMNKGGLLEIGELLRQYAPTLYQDYKSSQIISEERGEKELFALPWIKQKSSKPILLYRSDLADAYGINMTQLETIEDLDRVLSEVHRAIPDLIPFESGLQKGSKTSDILRLMYAKYGYCNMNYHELTFRLGEE